jgi:hypothetical protein
VAGAGAFFKEGKMKLFAYALIAAVLVATPALAEDLHFKIQNDTNNDITEVHVSTVSSNSWEENILDDNVGAGDSVDVTIADGETVCKYDVQVVFDDGSKNEWRNQNLCNFENGTYRIHL